MKVVVVISNPAAVDDTDSNIGVVVDFVGDD